MADVSPWVDTLSRYSYADTYETEDGQVFVVEREPMEPPPVGQYSTHMVRQGETLFGLAGYYYRGLADRPSRFWWAIMEANQIIDPTQPLRTGVEIKIPDFQYVQLWLAYSHEVIA